MDKVLLPYDIDGELGIESVHATKVGEYYQIDNIPFFADNIALGDIVKVELDNEALYFEELIKASGHNTIQVVFFMKDQLEMVTEWLVQNNCSWEGSHLESLISVDVPPDVSYNIIKQWLDNKLEEGILDYKEACLRSFDT